MNLLLVLPAISAGLLCTAVILPSRFSNQRAVKLGEVVRRLLGVQTVMAALLTVWTISSGSFLAASVVHMADIELFHFDSLACLMFLLISFIGWSVAHYSIRYLDGEPRQGVYFRWLSLAIGMVSIMAISGNLLLLVFTGIIASLAMHQLMVFYSQRDMAHRAAWTKFVISRLGDTLLLSACWALYQATGTLNLSSLFDQSSWTAVGEGNLFEIAMGLFVSGALVKSAQFPFHIWLPISLETPTPVSALMHAGIVNAGGFLLVRISPLLSQVPSVLAVAAVAGLITAVYGSLVMVTQTSVKKRLAYSTVAQMGFMMLQCGLGAFTAATIHLMAHSLYKAHAFLNSGELEFDSRLANSTPSCVLPLRQLLLLGGGLVILSGTAVAGLLHAEFLSAEMVKQGFFPVAALGAASLFWITIVLQFRKLPLLKIGVTGAIAILTLYATQHAVMAGALKISESGGLPTGLFFELICLILPMFVFLFVYSLNVNREPARSSTRSWFIHARNGFYVETWLNRRLEFMHRLS